MPKISNCYDLAEVWGIKFRSRPDEALKLVARAFGSRTRGPCFGTKND